MHIQIQCPPKKSVEIHWHIFIIKSTNKHTVVDPSTDLWHSSIKHSSHSRVQFNYFSIFSHLLLAFFSFAVEKIDSYFMPPLSPGEYVDECRNDPPITHIKLPELSCQCRWLCFFQTFSFKYFFFDSRIVIKQFPSETFYFCSLFNEWNKKLTSRNLRKKCGKIFNPKSESRYVIASASC